MAVRASGSAVFAPMLLIAVALGAGPVAAQTPSVTIGTNAPGSVFYAVGSDLALGILLILVEWTATGRAGDAPVASEARDV